MIRYNNHCRSFIAGFNYSQYNTGYDAIWAIELTANLGVDGCNVTSRIASFTDPDNKSTKVVL